MTSKHYQSWKKWNNNNFLAISNHDNAYYAHIFKRLGITKKMSILEIGYGNGLFLKYASNNGHDIEGMEVIEELLYTAKKHGYTIYKDINEIKKTSKYDLIIMFDVLEHIQQDRIPNFLENIGRHLNDSGRILVRTPNGASPLGLANQHGDITHLTVVTEAKINYWCGIINLNLHSSWGDKHPFIFSHNLKKAPSRILKLITHKMIERLIRFISPQSNGILSSNSIFIFNKKLKGIYHEQQ